ncbi:hemogen isoform X4 [Chrysemys picta bellii]|uniref:hemogen isoform X4 n=1 Tax=Chrysemys picta bellii TaxID=8478 RepID=UPI0032B18052
MEGLEKDHPYSGSSQQPPPAREEYTVPGAITHRLRDRELLRKRKAEAQEKDTVQERGKSTGPKRGRGAGRRRGRQQGTEPEPQPDVQEEVEKEPPEKAQASPGHHEEEPALSVAQELSGGTQQEAVEGPPAQDILHPAVRTKRYSYTWKRLYKADVSSPSCLQSCFIPLEELRYKLEL